MSKWKAACTPIKPGKRLLFLSIFRKQLIESIAGECTLVCVTQCVIQNVWDRRPETVACFSEERGEHVIEIQTETQTDFRVMHSFSARTILSSYPGSALGISTGDT